MDVINLKTVVIAEKHEQVAKYVAGLGGSAKKFNGATQLEHGDLGTTTIVEASGHLVGLVEPQKYDDKWAGSWRLDTLPMVPKEFKFALTGKMEKKRFDIIQREVKCADQIVIATDPDREGENIAYSILERIPGAMKKPIKRLWLNDLTQKGVAKGFANLRDARDTYNYFTEARTRQEADWLVGLNMTRLVTLKLQKRGFEGVFSVGRVQTPVLQLIVDNDNAIRDFKTQKYWKLVLHDSRNNVDYTTDKKISTKAAAQTALAAARQQTAVVQSVSTEDKSTTAPKLYSLTDVQGKAASQFGWSSTYTADVLETTHLTEWLTYPRTDANYITTNEFKGLASFAPTIQSAIDLPFDLVNLQPRAAFINEKAVQQAGHSALTPTLVDPGLDLVNIQDAKTPGAHSKVIPAEDRRKIYRMIARRALMMFAPDMKTRVTSIEVECDGQRYSLKAVKTTDAGFKSILKETVRNEQTPDVQEGQQLTLEPKLIEGTTKPPKRFTEAQVIKSIFTKYNLGTPATKSEILHTIVEVRRYVNKNTKGQLIPTERGITLTEFLRGSVFVSAKLTSAWEDYLAKIGDGSGKPQVFLDNVVKLISGGLSHYSTAIPELSATPKYTAPVRSDAIADCPKCKNGQISLVSGEKNSGKYSFYGCDNEKCNFTLPHKFGASGLEADTIRQLCVNKITDVLRLNGRKGSYQARLKLNSKYKLDMDFVKEGRK